MGVGDGSAIFHGDGEVVDEFNVIRGARGPPGRAPTQNEIQAAVGDLFHQNFLLRKDWENSKTVNIFNFLNRANALDYITTLTPNAIPTTIEIHRDAIGVVNKRTFRMNTLANRQGGNFSFNYNFQINAKNSVLLDTNNLSMVVVVYQENIKHAEETKIEVSDGVGYTVNPKPTFVIDTEKGMFLTKFIIDKTNINVDFSIQIKLIFKTLIVSSINTQMPCWVQIYGWYGVLNVIRSEINDAFFGVTSEHSIMPQAQMALGGHVLNGVGNAVDPEDAVNQQTMETFTNNRFPTKDFVSKTYATPSDISTEKANVLSVLNSRVNKFGDSIIIGGALDMRDKRVFNVASPTSDKDAVNKKFVDDMFEEVGGIVKVKQELDMQNKRILNVADPTTPTDAVNLKTITPLREIENVIQKQVLEPRFRTRTIHANTAPPFGNNHPYFVNLGGISGLPTNDEYNNEDNLSPFSPPPLVGRVPEKPSLLWHNILFRIIMPGTYEIEFSENTVDGGVQDPHAHNIIVRFEQYYKNSVSNTDSHIILFSPNSKEKLVFTTNTTKTYITARWWSSEKKKKIHN